MLLFDVFNTIIPLQTAESARLLSVSSSVLCCVLRNQENVLLNSPQSRKTLEGFTV